MATIDPVDEAGELTIEQEYDAATPARSAAPRSRCSAFQSGSLITVQNSLQWPMKL
jgi:hypothetical protein